MPMFHYLQCVSRKKGLSVADFRQQRQQHQPMVGSPGSPRGPAQNWKRYSGSRKRILTWAGCVFSSRPVNKGLGDIRRRWSFSQAARKIRVRAAKGIQ